MKHIEFLKKCQNHWTLMHSFKGTVTQDSLIYLRIQRDNLSCWKRSDTDKKEKRIFLIFEEAVSHIRLCNCSIMNFLMYKENLILKVCLLHEPCKTSAHGEYIMYNICIIGCSTLNKCVFFSLGKQSSLAA
jgi:hypothetical protein